MSSLGRLEPGLVLDERFEVVRLIKAGGMGAVYEVEDRWLDGRTFALKEVLPNPNQQALQQAKNHFIGEIEVMQSLLHPSIPKVQTAFFERGRFYFVMEYVEGKDLGRVLKAEGDPGLEVLRVLGWMVQILGALEHCHDQTSPPVIHRDIKPSNILWQPEDNRVVLIDFGIARAVESREGFWTGTPGYAPAEQQMGRPGASTDVYALGATMHHLLTGKRPRDFTFSSLGGEAGKVRGLQGIFDRVLQPWPQDRYRSAKQVKEDILSLGLSLMVPEVEEIHLFEQKALEFKSQVIDPLLRELMDRYGNECLTPYLPKNFSIIHFQLGSMMSFELQIHKDDATQSLSFYEKQGLLGPRLLGSVALGQEGAEAKARSLVEGFVADYEDFKGNSWQSLS